jgi:hypothetical protein
MRPTAALATLFASVLLASGALAAESRGDEESIVQPPRRHFTPPWKPAPGAAFSVSNASCGGSECDTVWIGHSAAGPGGAFLGVHVGGVWDFDSDIAGTDSTQGFTTSARPYSEFQSTPPVSQRTYTGLDYGNAINDGDTGLWQSRDQAGRKYVKTGVAGAWHADDMVGVKSNIANAGEPSATPIAGARSAWCGLREAGSMHAQDALTGNGLNGDLIMNGAGAMPEFPGYCDQWDQMLYKDFPSTGNGTVAFRFRTDLSRTVNTTVGWFNPDPTNPANYLLGVADSFMVYVGSPNEAAYDVNRRWFSEVLDLTRPWQQVFSRGGVCPVAGGDSAVTQAYSGLQPVGGSVRVVFRVKTNRGSSDLVASAGSYNSKQGAALVDQVQVDGGTTYGFDTVADVRARGLIPDLAQDGGAWATTGKPPTEYFRIRDLATLIYEDLCGAIGAPTRMCNMTGNVWTIGNTGDGQPLPLEIRQALESPTIDLAVRNAAPGTKNAQGIDQEIANSQEWTLDFDFYPGHMTLEQSVGVRPVSRTYAPATWKQPISGHPVWSSWSSGVLLVLEPQYCHRRWQWVQGNGSDIPADSIRVGIDVTTFGWRWGGDDLGNTRGTYFDNLRLGLSRRGGPAVAGQIEAQLQDQFPINEAVAPGDHAAFDTTTARMTTGIDIEGANSPVPGDSLIFFGSWGTGNGVTTGVRMDLVFRIDPGPGNFTVLGDRSSPLRNFDPAHPFFATYLANNGPYGTPGGHGGTWNRHVWNSARMDSAEIRLYKHGGMLPNPPVPWTHRWMGTLHESDPNWLTLGIDRPMCFYLGSPTFEHDCDGIPPAAYSGVPGYSREATKILPDGWFTPGTHIEYFARRSLLEDPSEVALYHDTTRVTPQNGHQQYGSEPNFDPARWASADVLPDMWKSTRYGGPGLACLLLVDGDDGGGTEAAYLGAADSLGYGKNNGAGVGWKGLGPNADPNDPAGFVAANRGQAGVAFDQFDVRGEFIGHPGARLQVIPETIGQADRSGPSPAMLAAFYKNVLHFTGNSRSYSLGGDYYRAPDDLALYTGFLEGATPESPRGLWLSGNNLAQEAQDYTEPDGPFKTFLAEKLGVAASYQDFFAASGSPGPTTEGFEPLAAWAHPGRVYGFENVCTHRPGILTVQAGTPGAAVAAQYVATAAGQRYPASIHRPTAVDRHYRTLFDGFDLTRLGGNYSSLADIGNTPGTNVGRLAWFDDAWSAHFQLCGNRTWIGVGDVPGVAPARWANVNLGPAPNPAAAGSPVRIRLTLARAQEITLRVHNVAGREVAVVRHRGLEGPNEVLWDGRLSGGARAAAGVYFYRVDGVDLDDAKTPRKVILLGAN